MNEMSLLVNQLSEGYLSAQVMVCVCFFVLGYALCQASGMGKAEVCLYAFPAGLAVYSVCSYLMLCLGIPFTRVSVSVVMVLIFMAGVWRYVGIRMAEPAGGTGAAGTTGLKGRTGAVDIKCEILTFAVALAVVFAVSVLLCCNILDVVVDNDTFYYFSTFPEAIVHEGRYLKYFDTFLTDAAPIGSIVYTVPYIFGFGETFGLQYLLDLDLLLVFAWALYGMIVKKYGDALKVRAICVSAVTTLFLATSTAYLTTAKWIMAGAYFMSYYFMTAVIGIMPGRRKPYAVLILFSVMTAMLRQEGVILVLLLIVLLSAGELYSDRELFLVYVIPVFLASALYYVRVFYILKVAPLYAFLTKGKALIILAAVAFTGLYVLLCRKRWDRYARLSLIRKNILHLVPAVLLLMNLALMVLIRGRYLNNLHMFYLNLRLRAGWGYFPFIIAALLVLTVIMAVADRQYALSFFDSLMISYVLGVLIVAFGRGDDLRKGVGDSGNRVLLTAVPLIVFAIALRLAGGCGGSDNGENGGKVG